MYHSCWSSFDRYMILFYESNIQSILLTWKNNVTCSYEPRRKWKKSHNGKNIMKAKMSYKNNTIINQAQPGMMKKLI